MSSNYWKKFDLYSDDRVFCQVDGMELEFSNDKSVYFGSIKYDGIKSNILLIRKLSEASSVAYTLDALETCQKLTLKEHMK